MTKWISVKEKKPFDNQLVKIKADYEDERYCEGIAIFKYYDVDERTEAWGWQIKEGYECILKPTHWMPLPEPPND